MAPYKPNEMTRFSVDLGNAAICSRYALSCSSVSFVSAASAATASSTRLSFTKVNFISAPYSRVAGLDRSHPPECPRTEYSASEMTLTKARAARFSR